VQGIVGEVLTEESEQVVAAAQVSGGIVRVDNEPSLQ
jgi:hypothetical protein